MPSIQGLSRFIDICEDQLVKGLIAEVHHRAPQFAASQDKVEMTRGIAQGLINEVRKNKVKTLLGASPKRILIGTTLGIVALYTTTKLIKAFINYETQRLAIKNGVSEALAQARKTGQLSP